ncbi:type 1 periplasmic binding fold superfamily protein [Flavobacteriales bacterium]|nr:type 1 periplasmic binding fold superfamily protein [Flavobacteriales bacterium]
MKPFKILIATTLLSLILISSCKKDDPEIPNEEEVITTLTYTLTPTGGGAPVVLTFKDLDGDGGNAPTITGGVLDSNVTYTGAIVLLNEQEDPAENITTEVRDEAEEHQLFYSTSSSDVSISYTDTDANGDPIGITTSLTTTNISSGTIKITLRHEPNKSASGVSTGDISNAGGETDIEVTFNLDVQ